MFKQLLEPHNFSVILFMLIVGLAWLFTNKAPTEVALPMLAIAAGISAGASAIRQGVNIGVPLQSQAPEGKA